MVVVSGQPGSSEQTHKKNRRKQSKKKIPGATDIVIDSDLEEDGNPTASTSAQLPPPPADDDDELMIDVDPSAAPLSSAPEFAPLSADAGKTALKSETRRIPIPPHRMTPLKKDWVNIFGPLTEILGLQVRMNVQRKCVEARTSKATKDIGALQKGADFVKAFALGFDVNDAIALLRLDDLYLDSFEIKDVKTLHGDHLSRAIGRIAGQDGKTKFTIENASRTRIVLADTKIHIMGSFQNIKIARDAIVSLILGSPPGKVYAGLRTVSSRMRQRAL
ncbi:Pre-rRNA-processing protein PNO1 [Favolaschia claudopus]|uniref:Pre-rRNA-processing protein PNO1 n=1 Tax=Favolaschia claudopus TaxID=2862362 RepID=A0AAW0CFV6_9AGAR